MPKDRRSKTGAIVAAVAMAVAFSGCSRDSSSVAEPDLEMVKDAMLADLGGWESGVLPEASWPATIKKLEPLKVYYDRAIVVALYRDESIESGYCAFQLDSSFYFLPLMRDDEKDEERTFTPLAPDGLWAYSRKLDADGGYLDSHEDFRISTEK